VEDLMQHIKGPDFPTGGMILGRAGIRETYYTGHGKITVRSKSNIEEMPNNRSRIVVTEIPYMVNKAELVKKIAELVKDKRVEGISDLRDESDKTGMRVVIELKRDANAQIVLNLLYRYTQLQDTVGIIMLALDNGVPKVMDLKTVLQRFLEFREDVVRRRTVFDLKKASDRAHILEGLRRAVDIVDDIIHTIRHTEGGQAEAKLAIMERFGFDDPQASAIVAFRLGQLAGLEILKIDNELGELHAKIEEYNDILSNRAHLLRIVKEELEDIKKRFGDGRRTRIEAISGDVDIEDLIPRQESIITRTHFGYVKRMAIDEYRAQRRGGRGISGLTRREEDFVEEMFACNSHDHLMYMTNLGRVYDTKCYEIPEGSRQSKGTNIVNLLPLVPGEKISSILKVADPDDEEFLIMVTKNGTIKRTALKNFAHIRKTGIIGIELAEGDELVTAVITDGTRQILVGTRNGMSIRFDENDLRPIGRTSMGVRAIRLKEGDEVIGMASVDGDSILLTVSEEGKGRLTPVSDFTLQQRGGQGIRNYDCRRGNHVAGFKVVDTEKDDAILISQNGTVIRMNVSDIAFQSRYGMGVNVMRLDEGDRIVTLAATLREDVEIEVEPAPEREEGEGREEAYAEPSLEELEALIREDGVDGEEQEDEHLTEEEEE
jgi:DNA gyrase subunit A